MCCEREDTQQNRPPGWRQGKRFCCEDGFKYLDKGKNSTVNLWLTVDGFLYLSHA